jgi:serine/threonine protein kinase
MLQLDKADDAIAIHEFDIEAELLSRMDHPNIIKLLGSGISPRPFLILERLRDISKLLDLDREITPRKSMFHKERFTFPEVLQLAKDLADALNYIQTDIHPEAMIIHRDLKPENLGLAADGHLKLFDFGLCRCVQKRSSSHQAYEMTGNTGSLRYMAPEVVLNQNYTEKVDVYSFAIVVWAVASNRPPFKGFDRGMHRERTVINNERPKPDGDWPPEFTELLESCWDRDFMKRPTFEVIADKLDKIRESLSKKSKIIRDGRSFLRRLSFSNRKT